MFQKGSIMLTPGKILTLFASFGACCFGAVWAQQGDEMPASKRRTAATPPTALRAENPAAATIASEQVIKVPVATADATEAKHFLGLSGQYRQFAAGFAPAQSPANQALNKAIKQYRDAEVNSAERDQARDKVSEGLSQLYDEHLASQEQQITELENRLAKLRDQLKRRRDAKVKMVDLKLEMVLSQADGLGWPESSVGDSLFVADERYRDPAVTLLRTNSIPSTTVAPMAVPAVPVAPATPATDVAPATERTRTTNPRY